MEIKPDTVIVPLGPWVACSVCNKTLASNEAKVIEAARDERHTIQHGVNLILPDWMPSRPALSEPRTVTTKIEFCCPSCL